MKGEKDVQVRARRKENKDVWTTSQTLRLGRMATFIYVVRITVLYSVAASPVLHRSDSNTGWRCRQLGLHREIEFTPVQLGFTITNIFPSPKNFRLLRRLRM